jgi:hypothetical protein
MSEILAGEHEAARQALRELLTQTATPPWEALDQALERLLASMGPDDRSPTEAWLADMIRRTTPRSDAIGERAAQAFNWTHETAPWISSEAAWLVGRLEHIRHVSVLDRLERLLRGEREPGENELMGALDAVTASPRLNDPVRGAQTEAWLAKLLLDARPRSNALLPIASRRLRWEARAAGIGMDPVIGRAASAAGSIAARPVIAAPRRAPSQPPSGGLVAAWVFGAVGVLVCVAVSGILVLAFLGQQASPYRTANGGSSGGPADGGAPSVSVVRGRIEVQMAASESADAYIHCDTLSAGALQGCQVTRTTMSDGGKGALGYVRSLKLLPDSSAVARPIIVHVHWNSVD